MTELSLVGVLRSRPVARGSQVGCMRPLGICEMSKERANLCCFYVLSLSNRRVSKQLIFRNVCLFKLVCVLLRVELRN
jgi:hypothetical protein